MKDKEANKKPAAASKASNPFIKMLEDKKRINDAIATNTPLSSLKGIKFVKPL